MEKCVCNCKIDAKSGMVDLHTEYPATKLTSFANVFWMLFRVKSVLYTMRSSVLYFRDIEPIFET